MVVILTNLFTISGCFYLGNGERVNSDIVEEMRKFNEFCYDECNKFAREGGDLELPESVGHFYKSKFQEYVQKFNDRSNGIKSIMSGLFNYFLT